MAGASSYAEWLARVGPGGGGGAGVEADAVEAVVGPGADGRNALVAEGDGAVAANRPSVLARKTRMWTHQGAGETCCGRAANLPDISTAPPPQLSHTGLIEI